MASGTMATANVPAKIVGAVLIFIVTIGFTMLPYRLRAVSKRKLRRVKCFCGGLFLALCFLHLLPDVMRNFYQIERLAELQKAYPVAELTVCVGLLLVLCTERLAHLFGIKQKKKDCDATSECCKEGCRRSEKSDSTPLIVATSVSYGTGCDEENRISINEFSSQEFSLVDADTNQNLPAQPGQNYDDAHRQSTLKIVASEKMEDSASSSSKVRSLCLIVALMLHSILEGLAVGLQRTTGGLVAILALISLHKCLLGFSLGVSLADSRATLVVHARNAVIFSVANPVGIVAGVCILFSGWSAVDALAMAFLTALATGSFVYITFFEILGRELNGGEDDDHRNLLYCVGGFCAFAGISAIPGASA